MDSQIFDMLCATQDNLEHVLLLLERLDETKHEMENKLHELQRQIGALHWTIKEKSNAAL